MKFVFTIMTGLLVAQFNLASTLEKKTILRTDDEIKAMVIVNDIIYFGGYFERVNEVNHPYLAAYDLRNKKLLDWNPKLDRYPKNLHIETNGEKLFITGEFFRIDGKDKTEFASFDLKTGLMDDGDPGGEAFKKFGLVPYSMAPTHDGIWITENDTMATVVKIKNDSTVSQPFNVNLQQARILEKGNRLFIVTAGVGGTYDDHDYIKYFSIDLKTGKYAPWELSFLPSGTSTYGGLYDVYDSSLADRFYIGCGEATGAFSGKTLRVLPQGSYDGVPFELEDKLLCLNPGHTLTVYSKADLTLLSASNFPDAFPFPDVLKTNANKVYGTRGRELFEVLIKE